MIFVNIAPPAKNLTPCQQKIGRQKQIINQGTPPQKKRKMENIIEQTYDKLNNKWDVSAKKLSDYCKNHKNGIGLVDDDIWLKDAECLRLKFECKYDENVFKVFVKTYSKQVKKIQLDRHIARKNSYKTL